MTYKDYNMVFKSADNDEFYSFMYSEGPSSSLMKAILYTGTHITITPFNSESVYMIKLKSSDNLIDTLSMLANFSGSSMDDIIADPETDPDPSTGLFV